MKFLCLLTLAAQAVLTLQAQTSDAPLPKIVYENVDTQTGSGDFEFFEFGYGGWGDTVRLAGAARSAVRFETAVPVSSYIGNPVSLQFELAFWEPGPHNPTEGPGRLIWKSALQTVSLADKGVTWLSFAVPEVALPAVVIWTVRFQGVGAGEVVIGPRLFGPPSVGSNDVGQPGYLVVNPLTNYWETFGSGFFEGRITAR